MFGINGLEKRIVFLEKRVLDLSVNNGIRSFENPEDFYFTRQEHIKDNFDRRIKKLEAFSSLLGYYYETKPSVAGWKKIKEKK